MHDYIPFQTSDAEQFSAQIHASFDPETMSFIHSAIRQNVLKIATIRLLLTKSGLGLTACKAYYEGMHAKLNYTGGGWY